MVYAQHRVMPKRWAPLVPAAAIVLYVATQITACLIQGGAYWYFHFWMVLFFVLIAGLNGIRPAFHAETGYRWLPLTFPVAWVAIDGIRVIWAHEHLAATWGSPAYALYGVPWLLQPLSIFGILGFELLVLVVNFTLAHLVIAWVDRDDHLLRPRFH